MPETTTILGIDCGTAITGWSILEAAAGKNPASSQYRLKAYGVIETHKFSPEEFRLLDLGQSIRELIEQYKPQVLAIESLFFFRNVTTAMKVSQARGVVIYEAVQRGLNYASYTPLQVKQQITGSGKADKKQVTYMVNKLFKLADKLKQDDTADAIAIAYCHALSLGPTR